MTGQLKPELVIAIVCPLGTNYNRFCEHLGQSLARFGYNLHHVHLSQHFSEILQSDAEVKDHDLDSVAGKIWAGDRIRETAEEPAVLAGLAVREIAAERDNSKPATGRCHLIVQVKRPEEVQRLRMVYGPTFWLVGLLPNPEEQSRFFEEHSLNPDEWIAKDGDEGRRLGQRTTKTFHLADCFLADDDTAGCDRFLDLIFGNPFVTPNEDERGMYLAYASSWSSADLSRQVGAAVIGDHGDVLGLGYNEVPRAGGGVYVGVDGSYRDCEIGYDANQRERERIAKEIAAYLQVDAAKADNLLKDTRLGLITEYGRAVHAEMAALLACARTGRSPVAASMFVTTFPCHNCARHTIAAGICRVVFVEPYPRSKALELHGDAAEIHHGAHNPGKNAGKQAKVRFEQFTGIGPRRYVDLFSIKLSSGREIEREMHGKKAQWIATDAKPRLNPNVSTYIEREQMELDDWKRLFPKTTT